MPVRRVAVIGTGVIGASWAASFLAHGLEVAAFDPAPGAEALLQAAVQSAWPALQALGLAPGADPSLLRVHATLEAALAGAEFVQENGPERLDAKRALFAAMADATPATTVLASSSSTRKITDVQGACRFPERVLLGHPFNPPHLVPLVEVAGGAGTSEVALAAALAFYRQIGKHPIRLRREMVGHVANRLQAALWQEAFHLVLEGVADVADIDAAICHGPGLRWALLGPFLNLHLSGGAGGFTQLMHHLGPANQAMWHDLGHLELNDAQTARLAELVAGYVKTLPLAETVAERDATLVGLLLAKRSAKALP